MGAKTRQRDGTNHNPPNASEGQRHEEDADDDHSSSTQTAQVYVGFKKKEIGSSAKHRDFPASLTPLQSSQCPRGHH